MQVHIHSYYRLYDVNELHFYICTYTSIKLSYDTARELNTSLLGTISSSDDATFTTVPPVVVPPEDILVFVFALVFMLVFVLAFVLSNKPLFLDAELLAPTMPLAIDAEAENAPIAPTPMRT